MAGAAQSRYRARVVPRHGAARRGSRVHWDRVGRIALVLVLFAVVVSYIGPSIGVLESWQESRAAESQLVELKRENAVLSEQARELEKPAALMAEARELGLIAPGEQGYVIDGLP